MAAVAAVTTTIERKSEAGLAVTTKKEPTAEMRSESSTETFNYNKIRATYFCYRISTGCLVGRRIVFDCSRS